MLKSVYFNVIKSKMNLFQNIRLPFEVDVDSFAKCRAAELASLTACVEVTKGNMRLFQQLPRHMRRRAQSRCYKRVPRRLQEAHKRQLEKCAKKVASKRPSRRHRRRPRNLLDEYNRRQRSITWLETHIWHAKRFRMTSQWGYKIPLHPCDKTVRACYRGAAKAALLQDLSYYCCIEISGVRMDITSGLREMTSSKCGLTFESVRYAQGQYEGSVVLYRRNTYPHDAIGPARFMWRPPTAKMGIDGDNTGAADWSCLWIWVHPSCFEEVISEFTAGFKLERLQTPDADGNEVPNGDAAPEPANDVGTKGEEPVTDKDKIPLLNGKPFLKLAPKLKPFYERMPVYHGEKVTVTVLKDTLVRLRLVGQLSTAILGDVLQVASLDCKNDQTDSQRWWKKLGDAALLAHSEQSRLWTDIRKVPFASHLPPNCIVGLTVCDPREAMPLSRTKVTPEIPDTCTNEFLFSKFVPATCQSWLWSRQTRDAVTFSKITDHEMNTLRSEHLVPGTRLNLGDKGSRIPVILIHNPGCRTSSITTEVGVGWDIILPAGWAMPFWISIVYRNVRVGGYREGVSISHQIGVPSFPEDFPDTATGLVHESSNGEMLTEKYFKYPPDKRPNYIKLGVVAPFQSPWPALVREWAKLGSVLIKPMDRDDGDVGSQSSSGFFVLREREVLLRLQQQACSRQKKLCRKSEEEVDVAAVLRDLPMFINSLVGIQLTVCGKGLISEFALVCAPLREDFQTKAKNPSSSSPVEPPHRDKRCRLRKERTKALRALSRKSKKSVSSSAENPLDQELRDTIADAASCSTEDVRKLWLPDAENVVKSCSRNVIGYVKSGCFSFYEGRVTGLSYVTLPGLVLLLQEAIENRWEPMVLVREAHTTKYRFARFSVLMP